jgi:RNA polymerase sigma factor (sigma-70 family)
MPSRRPTTTKSSRRAPAQLGRATKGRKPALAAKKTASRSTKALLRKPKPKVKLVLKKASTRAAAAPAARVPAKAPVKAKVTVPARKAAPLALVPARDRAPGRAAELTVPAPVVERVPREQLLSRYTPLIKYVVERLAVGLPKNVDHEDLMSAGMLGLLDAYEKYDSGKGTKFETYAVWRIKGAVLDQLRALDWASRSIRRKAREVEASVRRLDQKLGRQASEEEVAKEAKMPLADYHRLMDQVRGAVLLSLDEVRSPVDGD